MKNSKDALFERKMKSPYIPDLSKMRNMGMEIDESLNINEELMVKKLKMKFFFILENIKYKNY